MSTVTGYTASRMKRIEDACVVDGDIIVDNLILTRFDGTTIDAGPVRGPAGPKGDTGDISTAQFSALQQQVNALPKGLVWKYDLTDMGPEYLQVDAGEKQQYILQNLTLPTVSGRRYSYGFSGVVNFEQTNSGGDMYVLHDTVYAVNMFQGDGFRVMGENTSTSWTSAVNARSRAWKAGTTNMTKVSLLMRRTLGYGFMRIDPVWGRINFELYDEGALP